MRTKDINKEKAILDSAVKIFAERGYHKTTIKDIADQCGVATGTIYIYYKDKEKILNTIFENLWHSMYDDLKPVVERDISPILKIDALTEILFNQFEKNANLALVFVNEQRTIWQNRSERFSHFSDGFIKLGEGIVEEGIQKKYFKPELDVETTRTFLFGGIRTILRLWAQNPGRIKLDLVCQNVKVLIKGSLCDQAGSQNL